MKRWTSLLAAVALSALAGCCGDSVSGVRQCRPRAWTAQVRRGHAECSHAAHRTTRSTSTATARPTTSSATSSARSPRRTSTPRRASTTPSPPATSILLVRRTPPTSTQSECASVRRRRRQDAWRCRTSPAPASSPSTPPSVAAPSRARSPAARSTRTLRSPPPTPVDVTIQLPLVAGSDPVKLRITGAHIQFTKSGDKLMLGPHQRRHPQRRRAEGHHPERRQAAVGPRRGRPDELHQHDGPQHLRHGRRRHGLHGRLRQRGERLARQAACGTKMDEKIQTCEVATNSIIKNVLAPDVQMFQGRRLQAEHGEHHQGLAVDRPRVHRRQGDLLMI